MVICVLDYVMAKPKRRRLFETPCGVSKQFTSYKTTRTRLRKVLFHIYGKCRNDLYYIDNLMRTDGIDMWS